jgi:hypothetical protein
MTARSFLSHTALVAGALGMLQIPAAAQQSAAGLQQELHDWVEECQSRTDRDRGDRYRACDVRQQELPATGQRLTVDGGRNGGISVRAWDGDRVLVGARIQSSAPSTDEAKDIASHIRIVTDGGHIRADGPERRSQTSWSVSFVLLVPRHSDLSLRANNGGLHVAGVQGRIELSTHNGGIALDGVGGDVHGHTTNGGLAIDLAGNRWNGEGLDVTTHNGGVRMKVPANYSAQLETGTVNGGMHIDFPITVQGYIGHQLSTQLGAGGATIRVTTTNGGVSVRRG